MIGIKTSFEAITRAEYGLHFILALLIHVVVKGAARLSMETSNLMSIRTEAMRSLSNPENDLRHLRWPESLIMATLS
jgi:hypothetical protein